jgi:serine-aspartate repeat-containing protein C/D/E
MEPRLALSIEPVVVGSVYVEEDVGSDLHGDSFYLTFEGGAPGTQLTHVEISGDQNEAGFNVGDIFFDISSNNAESGPGRFGADEAFAFQIVSQDGIDQVRAIVEDGTSLLRLEFEGFEAGDRLVFSIDVDEVEDYDPLDPDVDRVNEGFDPITSGVEFQSSTLSAGFSAPHFEDLEVRTEFRNLYDALLEGTGLDLPADDQDGKRDRTAGGVGQDLQVVIPASLSGHVYHDANQNGRFDSDEVGLGGVAIQAIPLETVVDQPIESVVTDEEGYYQFERLMPGRYQIVEPDQPVGYFDWLDAAGTVDGQPNGVALNPGDAIDDVNLPGGSVGINYDFGEILPVSLVGRVHLSTADGDCFGEDVEHQPLAGVQIRLLDSNGQEVARTATDAAGDYAFFDLMPDTYTVVETTPVGLFDGGAQAGWIDGLRDNLSHVIDANTIGQIQLTSGQAASRYDFCEHAPAELTGHVYHDRNDDARKDTNEEGVAGVTVQLVDATDRVVAVSVTDADGAYGFRDLTAGHYRIVELHPDGWLDGKDAAGTVNGLIVGQAINPGDRIEQVVLGWGEQGRDYNFGELLPTQIFGSVHLSTIDGDCFSEDEFHEPLADVVVQLLDGDGQILREIRTDAQGQYAFLDLAPGTYGVHEITPSHLIDGGASAGHIDGRPVGVLHDSNTILQIDLRSGQQVRDVEFCEHEPATLAGNVYHDRDDDGQRHAGEEGIAGVTVIVFDAGGHEVGRTTTDDAGAYRFDRLERGEYRVVEQQPDGWDDGLDSPGLVDGIPQGTAVNPGDEIRQIHLGWGQAGVDYNFGELRLGSLAGRVHADLNADCELQDNEWVLAGVTIELLDASGQVIATVQTDDHGEFRFDQLRPGEYTLREIQPEGYFTSGQQAGSGGGYAVIDNLISQIAMESGGELIDYRFCEEPPSRISGYVFQDGPTISLNFNEGLPEDLRELRDGQFTPDDRPISGVVIQLRHGVFATPIDASSALPGYYGAGPISTATDENGYYEFIGLRKGNYSLYEIQPAGFHDGIDTSGTVPAIAINRHNFSEIEPQVVASLQQEPNFDAIVRIALFPDVQSQHNNFSEVQIDRPLIPITEVPAPAPVPPPTAIVFEPLTFVNVDVPMLPYQLTPYGRLRGVTGSTWHLSLLDGGTPRGTGETVATRGPVWFARTDQYRVAWNDSSTELMHWVITLDGQTTIERRFGLAQGIPIAGDFNGDGISEIGIFHEGQWFIDLNGNGHWDKEDVWARLGHFGDHPVVGDWNGDGKDDIGVFGIAWAGDPHAVRRELGLPDRQNETTGEPKNQPPRAEDATQARRDIRLRAAERTRSDLIDHVFHFGVTGHHAVSGDWNGDGIGNIGVFDEGLWHLDLNGDGLFGEEDAEATFGEEGDIPIAGDFNGDGIDEIGILSHGRLVLDMNRNYRIDPGDRVVQVDRRPGRPVVGDWNGDGTDDVAMVYEDERFVEVVARP